MSTANKRNQRCGAAVLLEVLRSEGARYVFGNPGTTELPLIDALVDAPDIRYVLALQVPVRLPWQTATHRLLADRGYLTSIRRVDSATVWATS